MRSAEPSVLIMAGGTGGHVFPALAVARELERQGMVPVWLGTRRGLEARVVPEAGYRLLTVAVSGLRGKGLLRWLVAPLMLAAAMLHSLLIVANTRPRLVLGMGGYVSGPGGIAAWLLRRPLLIHEQNAVLGTTNRHLAAIATRRLEAYAGVFAARFGAICTGNPVRAELLTVAARKPASTADTPPRILVLGGSQGAEALNTVVPPALAALDTACEVLHQSGGAGREATERRYRDMALTARVMPFIERMEDAYAWADLVICRAGALTLAEISVVGLAAILVPYPYATDDHQTANAAPFCEHGAARVIAPRDFDVERLSGTIRQLLGDPAERARMAEQMLRLARPQAAARVAEICLEYARG
jgi:UDP-N-acetylglucosamine--N-acetylmuramyl-(pentapeptide) pyrophosphoryl-undecaprenol N-acetylglucosamine transferase